MGIKFLHAADCHLGRAFPGLGSRDSERQRDLLTTFKRICALAVEKQVAALLLAGDVFDLYDPPPLLVGQMHAALEAVIGAGIRVFVSPGNHDDVGYTRSVWRRDLPGVHVFRSPSFQCETFFHGLAPVHVYGVAYDHTVCPDPLETVQLCEGGVHVALFHATVDPPATVPPLQRYYPVPFAQLFAAGFHYAALGHLHRRRISEEAGWVRAAYTGSPEGGATTYDANAR